MYGTTHAHLVHMCWPLSWALHQMGHNFATFSPVGVFAPNDIAMYSELVYTCSSFSDRSVIDSSLSNSAWCRSWFVCFFLMFYCRPCKGRGGGWHKASVSDCLPLAAPIGLSPLLILTLCGPERVLVVSTELLDDCKGGGGYTNFFLALTPPPPSLPPPPQPGVGSTGH